MVPDTVAPDLDWPTRRMNVASLELDSRNPRLEPATRGEAQRRIIQYLFEHEQAEDIAKSIARDGFFPNEPLLAIDGGKRRVVVEGNRRLAALKALREPTLLEEPHRRRVFRLHEFADLESIRRVPVTIAPSRRATDSLIATRHVGTPVRRWRLENRASFILDKLGEGYDEEELLNELRFTGADVQSARRTRAIAEIVRVLPLPDDVKAKVEAQDTNILTTLERVVASAPGRAALRIAPDQEHGFRGTTTQEEFIKGFTRLVSDLVQGPETSRTLNSNEDIRRYFNERVPADYRVESRSASFVPTEIIESRRSPTNSQSSQATTKPPAKRESATVLPKNLTASYTDNARVIDLLKELRKVKRKEFPNSGAFGLRVFFELVAFDYLRRKGKLDEIVTRMNGKTGGSLRAWQLKMSDIAPDLTEIAKKNLERGKARAVGRALSNNAAEPFTLSDMNSFVHSEVAMPTDRDIEQFWLRIEPLIRFMLEVPPDPTE